MLDTIKKACAQWFMTDYQDADYIVIHAVANGVNGKFYHCPSFIAESLWWGAQYSGQPDIGLELRFVVPTNNGQAENNSRYP
ncbi:MAG: hypothetical protein R6W74_02180 [Nitrosomonas halophila]